MHQKHPPAKIAVLVVGGGVGSVALEMFVPASVARAAIRKANCFIRACVVHLAAIAAALDLI